MSNLFAEYRPRDHPDREALPDSLVVREMASHDVEEVSRIAQERNGGDLPTHAAGFERALLRPQGMPGSLLLVAVVDGRTAGYATAGVFVPPMDAPVNCAPSGWYLTGVTIAPQMRRRGIGLELTRVRLDSIARTADFAHYFANAMNRASIDLHARLGFVEVTRDFWFPRTSFVGGVGILFRIDLGVRRLPSGPRGGS